MNNISFDVARLLQRIKFLRYISYRFNIYRHKRNIEKLSPYFSSSINIVRKKSINSHRDNHKIVWLFWWQGKEKMPLLVQKCYSSVFENKGNYKVILITKDNIRNYATLPEFIYLKVQNGQITLTHFSDILRFNLLSNYGGLWLDSTIFVTESLDNIKINQLVTFSGYGSNNAFNIALGRWTGFAIGGRAGEELFDFMNNFFVDYWKRNEKLQDYFLIDYALNYAWENNLSDFQECSKRNKFAQPNLFRLEPFLNKPYLDSTANRLKSNTFIFKLSNRKRINKSNPSNFFNNLERLY